MLHSLYQTLINIEIVNIYIYLDFQLASKKAVMVSKFVLLIAEGNSYEDLFKQKDEEVLNQQCRDWNQKVVCDFISRNRVIGREEQIKKIHQIF